MNRSKSDISRVWLTVGRVIVLALICFVSASSASAQSDESTGSPWSGLDTLSFDFRGVPLDQALKRLMGKTGLNVGYDPKALTAKISGCSIEDATIDMVLRCLLEPHGLIYQKLASDVYVITERKPTDSKGHEAGRSATGDVTLSGFVRDVETGEAFIGAHLYAPGLNVGTVTNAYGFYSLTLPRQTINLTISYLGYESESHEFHLDSDLRLDIDLKPMTVESAGVEIVASREDRIEERSNMSTMSIPIRQVKAMPVVMGEIDVLRSLQLLPGVQSGSEGSSGLYVRGGSPDQTLILLDGARVYNASHLFGLFSVFNGDAIRHVELIKGGFPARYGGRLSSVLEIGMKEGNNRSHGAEGAIGAVASRLMVEGPLISNKASFILSARRTYIDALISPFTPDNDVVLYFYDINAKVNYKLGDRDRVFLSLYRGKDRYGSVSKESTDLSSVFMQWGNLTSTARWNHVLTNKLFSNVTATYSRYEFEIGIEEEASFSGDDAFKLNYLSGIRDWGLKVDLDYLPAPNHYGRIGFESTYHTFRPGATVVKVRLDDEDDSNDLSLDPADPIDGFEYAAYVEDDFRISNRFKINAGIHASGFVVQGEHFTSIEPRVSARYLLPGRVALKASYAKMKQYILLLTNSSVGLPTDLWLPVTERVPPQTSDQMAVGLARSFSSGYEVSVEAYYKWMHQLIEFKEGASFLGIDKDWQNKIESGNGRARGVELLVQKKLGRTTGWLGYTLSWTDRRFDNLNRGRVFPFKYDSRHDLAAVVSHKISPRLEISGNWVYSTGSAVTLPTTTYRLHPFVDGQSCFDCTIDTFDKRNNYRQPAHHRLDFAINWSPTQSGKQMLTAGVYNLYNRKNPFFVWVREDDGQLMQFSLLPILPYVTYRRSF